MSLLALWIVEHLDVLRDILRLAIELDGDEFHGPDRWAADMGRQRVLERAGWIFWRCFASTWSLQRETVLAELLAQLANYGY